MISLGFHGTWWLSRDLLGNPGGLAMEVLERANYPRGSFTVGIPSQKRRYFLPFQWSNIGLNMVELNFEPCEPLRIALSYLIILSWLIGFPTTYYETHQFGSISIYKSLYSHLTRLFTIADVKPVGYPQTNMKSVKSPCDTPSLPGARPRASRCSSARRRHPWPNVVGKRPLGLAASGSPA